MAHLTNSCRLSVHVAQGRGGTVKTSQNDVPSRFVHGNAQDWGAAIKMLKEDLFAVPL